MSEVEPFMGSPEARAWIEARIEADVSESGRRRGFVGNPGPVVTAREER